MVLRKIVLCSVKKPLFSYSEKQIKYVLIQIGCNDSSAGIARLKSLGGRAGTSPKVKGKSTFNVARPCKLSLTIAISTLLELRDGDMQFLSRANLPFYKVLLPYYTYYTSILELVIHLWKLMASIPQHFGKPKSLRLAQEESFRSVGMGYEERQRLASTISFSSALWMATDAVATR